MISIIFKYDTDNFKMNFEIRVIGNLLLVLEILVKFFFTKFSKGPPFGTMNFNIENAISEIRKVKNCEIPKIVAMATVDDCR